MDGGLRKDEARVLFLVRHFCVMTARLIAADAADAKDTDTSCVQSEARPQRVNELS